MSSDRQKTLEQTAFEQVAKLSDVGALGEKSVDQAFRPLLNQFNQSGKYGHSAAEMARLQQQELRARGIIFAVAVTVIALLIWAAFASLEQIARGQGRVIPSQQLQVIQSQDGGVVEQILIREGEMVERGQVLLRIDPTRFNANYQEGVVQKFALEAKVARLSALINDTVLTYDMQELTAEQQNVLLQEQGAYEEARHELKQRLMIVEQQLTQRQRELENARTTLNTASQLFAMTDRELEVTRPLLRSGAISPMELLELEKKHSSVQGEKLGAQAQVRLVQARIDESKAQYQEVIHTTRNQWRSELGDARNLLGGLSEKVVGLRDQVNSSEIRSPVNGTVQRIFYNTIGGVVQPAQTVMEIVPADDALLIEARVAPRDIAFLKPDLPAVIKLDAYDFSIYGGISATLTHISADTIEDDKGNPFYLVRARTNDTEFTDKYSVIPGMTAQLDIMTGRKTVLEYLMKPLLRAKSNALTER